MVSREPEDWRDTQSATLAESTCLQLQKPYVSST